MHLVEPVLEAAVVPIAPKPELRRAFGRFPTGIAVVTTLAADGAPYGITINSFASVSMQPPIVSWNVIRGCKAHLMIRQAQRFVVNVLAEHQRAIAQQMAQPRADRFSGIAHRASAGGLPLLDGTVASFECALLSTVEAGDHDIVLGQVDRFEHRDGAPLVYWSGDYAQTTAYRLSGNP